MDTKTNSEPIEIYDKSVNNPDAQNFLEQAAFLKFVAQQLKKMRTEDNKFIGDIAKNNSLVKQFDRVKADILELKEKITKEKTQFEAALEQINQRRRQLSLAIMQLTRQKSMGEIEQGNYHSTKYELEMKRKSLGNQLQLLNKNISLYNNLLKKVIPEKKFDIIEETHAAPDVHNLDEPLDDDEFLMEQSSEGITYMGVLASDVEKAIMEKKKNEQNRHNQISEKYARVNNPRLNIITETGKQYFFPLSQNKIVKIGRSSQNDIQIPSPAISRNHSEIRFENNDFYIVDLESSNGTFVNDKMIIRRKIEANDTISIGGTRLIFLI